MWPDVLHAGRELREREPFALLQEERGPLRSEVLPERKMRDSDRGLLQARAEGWLSQDEVLRRDPGLLRREVSLRDRLGQVRRCALLQHEDRGVFAVSRSAQEEPVLLSEAAVDGTGVEVLPARDSQHQRQTPCLLPAR
jgi:hypothetical protein